jgi:hypothetical protein
VRVRRFFRFTPSAAAAAAAAAVVGILTRPRPMLPAGGSDECTTASPSPPAPMPLASDTICGVCRYTGQSDARDCTMSAYNSILASYSASGVDASSVVVVHRVTRCKYSVDMPCRTEDARCAE